MPNLIINPAGPLRGSVTVPGDKSISHRALLLGALAEGDTLVRGWLPAEDCQATLRCVRGLGVSVDVVDNALDKPGFSEKPGLYGEQTNQQTNYLAYLSLNSRFKIFPAAEIGRASRNATRFGTL